MKNKIHLKRLVMTSMMVAASVILDFLFKAIPLLDMPAGGSISLNMLPLLFLGSFFGPYYGILGGTIFGLLNFFIDGGASSLHWGSFFLDYIVAFGALGLSGIFYKKVMKGSFLYINLAFIVGTIGRYISTSFSGAIFFGEYAGTNNPYFYSFILYNAPYMFASLGVCLIIMNLSYKQLKSGLHAMNLIEAN